MQTNNSVYLLIMSHPSCKAVSYGLSATWFCSVVSESSKRSKYKQSYYHNTLLRINVSILNYCCLFDNKDGYFLFFYSSKYKIKFLERFPLFVFGFIFVQLSVLVTTNDLYKDIRGWKDGLVSEGEAKRSGKNIDYYNYRKIS